MKNTVFTGMATAIVTPMTKDGIDYDAQPRKIRFLMFFPINRVYLSVFTVNYQHFQPTKILFFIQQMLFSVYFAIKYRLNFATFRAVTSCLYAFAAVLRKKAYKPPFAPAIQLIIRPALRPNDRRILHLLCMSAYRIAAAAIEFTEAPIPQLQR